MKLPYLYKNIWICILRYLRPTDIIRLSLSSKVMRRAFMTDQIWRIISGGMTKPYYPSVEQWACIDSIINDKSRVRVTDGAVGSGKTVVGLVAALKLQERDEDAKVYIIVPPNLLNMWQQTLAKMFNLDYYLLYSTNPSYKGISETCIPDGTKIIMTTQVIFNRLLKNTTQVGFNDIIVCDEYKAYRGILGVGRIIIGLNATYEGKEVTLKLNRSNKNLTPVINLTYDLPIVKFSVTQILCQHNISLPNIATHGRVPLKDRDTSGLFKGEDSLEIDERLNLIYQRLYPYISYPFIGKTHLPGVVKLGRKNINRVGSPDLGTDRHGFLYYIKRSPKFEKMLELITPIIKAGEKIIVFDRNIDFLPYLAYCLDDLGFTTYLFTTDYTPTARAKLLDKFKSGPPSILISSYRMLAEGHNLHEANHLIFYAPVLSKGKYEQAIGRCHRFPQSKQVYAYHLFCSPLERAIYEYPSSNLFTPSKTINLYQALSVINQYGYWSYAKGPLPACPLKLVLKITPPIDPDDPEEPDIKIFPWELSIQTVGTTKYKRKFHIKALRRGNKEIDIEFDDDQKQETLTHRKNGQYIPKGTQMNKYQDKFIFQL